MPQHTVAVDPWLEGGGVFFDHDIKVARLIMGSIFPKMHGCHWMSDIHVGPVL